MKHDLWPHCLDPGSRPIDSPSNILTHSIHISTGMNGVRQSLGTEPLNLITISSVSVGIGIR